MLLSYHNDPAVKAKYIARFEAHRAADEVIQGTGFDGWLDCDGGMQPAPTHYMLLPAAPSPHPEEGALLLGGDEGGKKGGHA